MTSPVDTSVKWFWSGMSNAPRLDGTAGSLIGVLDVCLVTGCDIKPLTGLTLKGGIATAAFAGQHSARADTVILVDGVTGDLAGLNGEQKVVARPTTNTLTFATDLPDGAAQGVITIKMAPTGWAKPFGSGTLDAGQTTAGTLTPSYGSVSSIWGATAHALIFGALPGIARSPVIWRTQVAQPARVNSRAGPPTAMSARGVPGVARG